LSDGALPPQHFHRRDFVDRIFIAAILSTAFSPPRFCRHHFHRRDFVDSIFTAAIFDTLLLNQSGNIFTVLLFHRRDFVDSIYIAAIFDS
jgi:hypothetical protein